MSKMTFIKVKAKSENVYSSRVVWLTIWTLLEVIFDLSESQKLARTNPLVSIPRNPKKTSAALYGIKEMDVTEVDSDDVVMALVVNLSVWSSEDILSTQSMVDDIANPSPNSSEVAAAVQARRLWLQSAVNPFSTWRLHVAWMYGEGAHGQYVRRT